MCTLLRLLMMLTLVQLAQCCAAPIYKLVNDPIDYDSNENYPWLVMIRNIGIEQYFGLSYGSLIHPKAVVTPQSGIAGFSAYDLFVETHCTLLKSLKIVNCTRRKVTKIIVGESLNNYYVDSTQNLYSILILEEPFDMKKRIATIDLPESIEDIDEDNCFFPRWMRELKYLDIYKRDYETGLVTIAYKTPLVEGIPDIGNFNKTQLATEKGWIIPIPSNQRYRQDMRKNPLNFMGSPLVCRLREDSKKVVLAGMGLFWILVTYTDDNATDISDISHGGTIMTLVGDKNMIMKQLNENV